MIAAGLDIGGTKIAVQKFDQDWQLAEQRRVPTPESYDGLVMAVKDQIDWATGGNRDMPVGVGSAGLINPGTGLAITANLPATGRPFARDVAQAANRQVPFLNDCRAMTLSEAVFGAGQDASVVLGLILGTGVGGGVAVDGGLFEGPAGVGGEFGHIATSAGLVSQHGLPVIRCGCGRLGCIETLIAGPGLARIAEARTGTPHSPEEIAAKRREKHALSEVWQIWCGLVADLLATLSFAIDPQVVVIGGGLSRIDGLVADLDAALQAAQFDGFAVPEIRLTEGGDASGARGAAYYAWKVAADG